MKRLFASTLAALAMLPFSLAAQDAPEAGEEPAPFRRSIDIKLETRADFTWEDPQGPGETMSGFHGRYLNLMVNGDIAPGLSYAWRQRFNKFSDLGNDVFSATDWIYLRYSFGRHWNVAAGKQVVLIGGYEYDAAPIDVFFASRFWNNIACFQFGASVGYTTSDGRNTFTAQVTNSPYAAKLSQGLYAYNLYWAGRIGNVRTLWSVNMIEYERGRYANFIALGNTFSSGPVEIELDLMNRATKHHKFFFGDYSVIGKVSCDVLPWMSVFAKGGYDRFRALPGADEHMDAPFYGGGLEFFPFHGSRNLRVHAVVDRYADNDGVKATEVNIGLKWRVTLFSRK